MRFAPALLLALALPGCVSRPPVTPADFDATITRADFADWLASYPLETKRETIEKVEKGGIVVLEYDWLGDDGELAVAVRSRVYWTRSTAEAEAAYRKMREGAERDRGREGIAWYPVLSGGSWAEEKKCYRLVRIDRQTVGHVMFARREGVAVMVSITGIHSEDPKQFEKKLEPELAKLSQHAPLAPPATTPGGPVRRDGRR
jgi:hypothetical protein